MNPRELFNKSMTAASVAEAEGFLGTSRAFQDLAFAIFNLSPPEEGEAFMENTPERGIMSDRVE